MVSSIRSQANAAVYCEVKSNLTQEQFHTRTLTAEDVDAFKTLRMQALSEFPEYFLDTVEQGRKRSTQEWCDYLIGETRRVFGLFDHETLIGIASIFQPDELNPHIAQFAMGYIAPQYRGKSLSSLLYKARIEWAINETAFTTLKISHRKGNAASKKAILKHGFTYIEDRQENFGDGSTDWSCKYERIIER